MTGQCAYGGCTSDTVSYTWMSLDNGRELTFCAAHAPPDAKRIPPPPGPPADTVDQVTIVGEPTILTPPQDGTSLDAEDVFAVCEMYAKRYPGCTFVLDPEAGGEQLAQRINREIDGVEVFTFSQKTTPMCAASQRLAEDVAAGRIRYNPAACEELSRHVLAAAAKFIGSMWRLVKPRGKKLPIDGAIALAMANDVLASRPPPRKSVYAERAKMWREAGIIDDD